jgi:hypothetical protein
MQVFNKTYDCVEPTHKWQNDTIIIGFLLLKEIQISIFVYATYGCILP